jgi:hypothetical protein
MILFIGQHGVARPANRRATIAVAASASKLFIQSRPDMRILRPALKQLSLAGGDADARPQVLNVGCSQTW